MSLLPLWGLRMRLRRKEAPNPLKVARWTDVDGGGGESAVGGVVVGAVGGGDLGALLLLLIPTRRTSLIKSMSVRSAKSGLLRGRASDRSSQREEEGERPLIPDFTLWRIFRSKTPFLKRLKAEILV